jgi:hypothetical protein
MWLENITQDGSNVVGMAVTCLTTYVEKNKNVRIHNLH